MIAQGARGGKLTVLIRRLKSWRRSRALAQTHIQLTALRQGALSAQDDMSRDYLIVSANALLGDLQARGIITLAERRDLAHDWIKDFVRECLPTFYRDKNTEAINRLGWFLSS